jgi:penicillin V acylase-like amidase (Ntn superfamily)
MKMIKKQLFTLLITTVLLSLFFSVPAYACSRVLWADGGKAVVVGRTMDWFADMKTNLWVLPRGITRDGAAGKNTLHWTAKYGSVVATAYDICSTDGINERGLTANLLWLAESDYGKRDNSIPGLAISLWAQYMLDNFATVAEVVEFANKGSFQLVTANMPGTKETATVHLSLADASGNSAIIEYSGGKPNIYHDRKYTVMTNSPLFGEQLANMKQYKAFGGSKQLPGSNEAADRFVRAASYLTTLPKPNTYRENIAYILSVMRNISAPFSVSTDPARPNISSTRWRTIADLTNRVYYFESTISPNIVWVELDELNFKAGAPVKKLDLVRELDLVGDVSRKFKNSKPFVFIGAERE